MKFQIVCLRDIKTDTHSQPQFVPHLESWRRALSDAINKPDATTATLDFVKHPEDFEAYHLGEWEDNTANFFVENDAATLITRKRLFLMTELLMPRN